jgi:hypothetical protein
MRFLTIVFCFFCSISFAQNKFVNSVHIDFYGNQVDGDGYSGYNHIGIQTGLGSLYLLGKLNGGIGFEINYVTKGARVWPQPKNGLKDFVFNLSYFEVPIFYVFNKWGVPFEIGPTISYLIAAKREFNGTPHPISSSYREIELGGMIGFNYKMTNKLYFKFRITNSISPIFKVDSGAFWGLTVGNFHRGAGLNLTYYFSKPNFKQPKDQSVVN